MRATTAPLGPRTCRHARDMQGVERAGPQRRTHADGGDEASHQVPALSHALLPVIVERRGCDGRPVHHACHDVAVGSQRHRYYGTPFETWHDERGFHVRDHVNPTQAFYRRMALLAEAGAFRLCARCGRPFLADRSRGNLAKYCSSSCNSMASEERRRLARGGALERQRPPRGGHRSHWPKVSARHQTVVRGVWGRKQVGAKNPL